LSQLQFFVFIHTLLLSLAKGCFKQARVNTPVHFFSSFFYTKLLESGGTEQVGAWTARRGADVFGKKFVFVPINIPGHWSMFVVVNPGLVEKNLGLKDNVNETINNGEYACLIHLNSINGSHNTDKIAKHLRNWLNKEWLKCGKREHMAKNETGEERKCGPFNARSMVAYSPVGN